MTRVILAILTAITALAAVLIVLGRSDRRGAERLVTAWETDPLAALYPEGSRC